MDLTLTAPALLSPAISLLLLAYTNRFLSLAALMRDLYGRYRGPWYTSRTAFRPDSG